MVQRILKKPLSLRKSFFLLGPRATGKTRWVRSHFPNAIYIDLLDMEEYRDLLANPHGLQKRIPPNFDGWIIIGEIQKIPELLNEIHRLIELENYRFILTGSSARSLRKKGVNLLAGRALIYHLHPLSIQELGDQFSLEHSLKYGQLPALLSEPDPKAYMASYIHTYLREEILQEGLARNLATFTAFLESASFAQGSVLNLSNVARQSGISRHIVENYFDILDDLLLSVRIPIFTKRAKRQLVTHPKFFFFDVGVYRALRPTGYIDSIEEVEGVALETLFLQEVRALDDYLELEYEIYYWRTKSGNEVDFVLYGPHGLIAFEIKRASRLESKDFNGLKVFKTD